MYHTHLSGDRIYRQIQDLHASFDKTEDRNQRDVEMEIDVITIWTLGTL